MQRTMIGKPSDFFLTLTTFFAILLPGTMLVFLVLAGWPRPLPILPSGLPGSFGPWFAFFVASYLAGQLLYALGSWLLDPLYDWMDLGFKSRGRRTRFKILEDSVRSVLFGGLKGSMLAKARAMILARGPQAWALVEQADADSKFFRAVTIVAAWGTPMALFRDAGWRLGAPIAASLLVIASVLVFRLISCHYPPATDPGQKPVTAPVAPTATAPSLAPVAQPATAPTDQTSLYRASLEIDTWLCTVSPIGFTFGYGVLTICGLWLVASVLLIVWGWLAGIGGVPPSTYTLAACWALMLVAFFRYAVRRADRDKTALEFTMELADAVPGRQ
jgi:hypothetical protein